MNLNLILNDDNNLDKNISMNVEENHTGYTHRALNINNIQATQKTLEELKSHITIEPITLTVDGQFFIRDQDLNAIEIY